MTWTELLPGQPLRLEECSWRALAEMLAAGSDMLLLPIGATEQHGPHLPVSVDATLLQGIVDAALPQLHLYTYRMSEVVRDRLKQVHFGR